MSLAMQNDQDELEACQDFRKYRIAQVRFPNSKPWKLTGYMFSTRFLFPAPEQDDSLRQLSRPDVQSILDQACTQNNVPLGTLGTVSHYR